MCRTKTETLRNWEQQKSTPNTHAAILIKLIKTYPDTLDIMAAV